jgi:hypothetical protein
MYSGCYLFQPGDNIRLIAYLEIFVASRRKNPNVGGSRKNLEVSLSESSRKFITCIRKYMILYLNLLEKNTDLWTLEKAYTYLRTDKRVPPNYTNYARLYFFCTLKNSFSFLFCSLHCV